MTPEENFDRLRVIASRSSYLYGFDQDAVRFALLMINSLADALSIRTSRSAEQVIEQHSELVAKGEKP